MYVMYTLYLSVYLYNVNACNSSVDLKLHMSKSNLLFVS